MVNKSMIIGLIIKICDEIFLQKIIWNKYYCKSFKNILRKNPLNSASIQNFIELVFNIFEV